MGDKNKPTSVVQEVQDDGIGKNSSQNSPKEKASNGSDDKGNQSNLSNFLVSSLSSVTHLCQNWIWLISTLFPLANTQNRRWVGLCNDDNMRRKCSRCGYRNAIDVSGVW
jgi:hypothetical protein